MVRTNHFYCFFAGIYLLLYSYTVIASSNNIHGGSFLAMSGEDTVLLLSDSRFSSLNPMFLTQSKRSVFRVGTSTLVGCFGLDSDARALVRILREELADHNDNSLHLDPENIGSLISNKLFENNFILSPIVIGINSENQPYICSMDGIGALTESTQYAAVGTSSAALLSQCESMFEEGLSAEKLMEKAESIFKASLKRDILSGGKIHIYSICSNIIREKIVDFKDV